MLIKPPGMLELNSMCPACGNYYFESGVVSYNNFGATAFSDGYTIGSNEPYWLTRCPRCKQFFAKSHIFKLPRSVSPEFDTSTLIRLIDKTQDEKNRELYKHRLEEKRKKEALYGHLGGRFNDENTKAGFIAEAISQGQYYPVLVTEREKDDFRLRLHKDLWHEYNIKRETVSDKDYGELCYKIIDMIESRKVLLYNDRITLAELYRNVGEFEKCLLLLEFFKRPNTAEKYIDKIRDEAMKQNKATVTVE